MKGSRGRVILFRSFALLIIILGGLSVWFYYSVWVQPGYKVAGDKFVMAIVNNQPDTSYNMLSDNLKKMVGDKQSWQKQLDSSFRGFRVTTKLLSAQPVQDPIPTYGKNSSPERLTYRFDFNNGRTYWVYIVVLRSSGTWKIDEITSQIE
ncbi:MAG TPA: hypothetical protein VNE40_02825 [Candidatus Dormibacteraeota bacterium]|nr:hypothetical protein [Candidatus Dormibacteraeota bacterium]